MQKLMIILLVVGVALGAYFWYRTYLLEQENQARLAEEERLQAVIAQQEADNKDLLAMQVEQSQNGKQAMETDPWVGHQRSGYEELESAGGLLPAQISLITSSHQHKDYHLTSSGLMDIELVHRRGHILQFAYSLPPAVGAEQPLSVHIPQYPDALAQVPLRTGSAVASVEIIPIINPDNRTQSQREYGLWFHLGRPADGWDERFVVPLGQGGSRGENFRLQSLLAAGPQDLQVQKLELFAVIATDKRGGERELFRIELSR